MKIRLAMGAAAAVAGALFSMPAAAAACTDSFDLGMLGPPGAAPLYNAFDGAQPFVDCYDFVLNDSTDAFGLSLEWDWSLAKGIDLSSVSLSGTGLAGTVIDDSPAQFDFGGLMGGTYRLIVSGLVSDAGQPRYFDGPVGYVGVLATHRAPGAVPEPDTYALLALGLAVAGWVGRRKAASPAPQAA